MATTKAKTIVTPDVETTTETPTSDYTVTFTLQSGRTRTFTDKSIADEFKTNNTKPAAGVVDPRHGVDYIVSEV
jgi:hypothetical protein